MGVINKIIKKVYRMIHKAAVKTLLFLKGKRNEFLWQLNDKREDRRVLYSEGIRRIKPLSSSGWHYGTYFFKCSGDDSFYFVKKIKNESIAMREVDFYSMALDSQSEILNYVPKYYKSINNNGYTYILMEYVGWIRMDHIKRNDLSINERCEIVSNLFSLYKLLLELKISHNDIRKENFFVCGKNIKLFDFGYSVRFDKKEALICQTSKYELSRLNEKNRPNDDCIDDAFSMLNIMKSINPDMYANQKDLWIKMNDYIGENIVSIRGAYNK